MHYAPVCNLGGDDTAAIKMTHSDDIGKMKELCEQLAEGAVFASQPALPKLFTLLARVIERQHHEIESLKAKINKQDLQRASTAVSAVDAAHGSYDLGGDAECPPRRQN